MLDTTATRILPDKRLTDGTFFSNFTNLELANFSNLAFVLFLIISVFHGGKSCPPFCATSNFLISQNLSNISEQSSASSTNAHFCPKTHKSAQDDLCHASSSARLTTVYPVVLNPSFSNLVSPLSSPVINRRLVSLSNLLRSRKSSPPWWWSTSSAGPTSTRSGTTSRPTAPSGRGLTEGSKLTTTRNKEMELCFYRKIIFDRKNRKPGKRQ